MSVLHKLMSARTLWILAIVIGAGVLIALYASSDARNGDRAGAIGANSAKGELMLMTSLPLIWGETQDMQELLESSAAPHPFYAELTSGYNVTPVDSLVAGEDVLSSADPDILLLVQPRPLTPEELVAVDDWVRGGGRALILADPMLRMESRYPIGDKRRPQAVSLMSPLFERWGLDFTFDDLEGGGLQRMEAGDFTVLAADVGGYARRAEQDAAIADCTVADLTMMARCDIGKGKAILIADADMVDSELMAQSDNGQFLIQLIAEAQMRENAE